MYRIGIDARLTYYTRAGIAQYTRHLIRELAAIDSANQYVVLQSRKHDENLATAPNQRRATVWTPAHNRLERWAMAVEVAPLRLDLLHNPDYIPPANGRYRSVICVHDLTFLHYPQFITRQSRRYYNGQIAAATRRADHILALSEASKADIVNLLSVPPEKITVTYLAADETFKPKPAAEVAAHLQRLGLSSGYILHVGTVEPRKNIDGLLRAYATLRSTLPDAPPLVLAGRRGWLADDLPALAEELRVTGSVRWLEDLKQEDFPVLYAGAAVLCMPSFYEGFGLPALEAMACGTPVVAANRPGLTEVVGEDGLLVDPDKPDDMAEQLRRILTDASLAADLSRRGPLRAAQFSWQKVARQVLEVYRQVLA